MHLPDELESQFMKYAMPLLIISTGMTSLLSFYEMYHYENILSGIEDQLEREQQTQHQQQQTKPPVQLEFAKLHHTDAQPIEQKVSERDNVHLTSIPESEPRTWV